jgi:hypothetical protein
VTPLDEYSSSYPMSAKSLAGKVKGARKFVKGSDLPTGGGIGKGVTPVTGKKAKTRRKR